MIERDMKIKERPERFQEYENLQYLDVIITFDMIAYQSVLERILNIIL